MAIITELQRQAIDSETDVLSLLRSALLVAHKLDLEDFRLWLECELTGYTDKKYLPDYRLIKGELKAFDQYTGWIPVVVSHREMEDVLTKREITESIASLYDLLKSEKAREGFVISIDGSTALKISQLTGIQTNYKIDVSSSSIANIVEQVKNKILEWSLELEKNGIMGENLSFTDVEKEKAREAPSITNFITFNGDVSNSQIQQGSENSKQDLPITT